MTLRSYINTSGEFCDKCNKPMNPETPGMEVHGNSKETGQQVIWVHIDCLQKEIRKIEKQHIVEQRFPVQR
ncbi:MAG TPA: hypothetical protein VH187_07945 [Scandinavium sp.]|jgi:hypothetical protein|uniref:hypothetical protein n=1 Tax=Scandinavium sp. TaxID=2830653 RepID=UPI002E37082A|nr:hypothetical protein [Scandinavium sp.]HEX4501076.1 hypothetical protein [Scandinavium sp.]